MPVRVMLVDDSAIVRGLVTRALSGDPNIEIVASACNGLMALNMLPQFKPDVVVLDIEMPEMDGMTALPKLLAAQPGLVVIMSSSLTERNAAISLKALELGAMDYVAKPSARDAAALESFYRELNEKVRVLGGKGKVLSPAPKFTSPPKPVSAPFVATAVKTTISAALETLPVTSNPVRALAIASSTGGPQALVGLFTSLKGKLNHIPIFITQHMPPTFTIILAEHIAKAGERACAEGKNGEVIQSGRTYLAPGDFHMLAEKRNGQSVIALNQQPQVNFCRPAADPMLQSLSAIYGNGLLVVVLTGMGQDGMEGARTAVGAGGVVIAQDEASCVVWGMPKAVAERKLCQAILPLNQIADYVMRRCV